LLKSLLLIVAGFFVKVGILITAPVYYFVARTGVGADLCRKFRFQPIRLHYYQPIPRYETLPDSIVTEAQTLPGIQLDRDRFSATLKHLSKKSAEAQWPDKAGALGQYYTNNDNFGFSSAALLHTMIRTHNTRKVIEIGGGFSSLISLHALRLNHGDNFRFDCVEPYPWSWLEETLRAQSGARLLKQPVEQLAPDMLADLAENDILFIDSSHCVRLASDVNFLYLQVIPRLKPGVIVHIHDIYIPYEYPRVHFHGRQKLFWNEQYLLQALLTDNPKLEVILPGFFVQKDMETEFAAAFPAYDPVKHRRTSSFWMRVCG
jgi:predicted O-methyltransferase YrrM